MKVLRCPEKAKHLAKTTAENVIFASFVRLVIYDKLLRIVKNASTAMVPLQMNSLATVLGSAKQVCEYVSSADSGVVIEIEINDNFEKMEKSYSGVRIQIYYLTESTDFP